MSAPPGFQIAAFARKRLHRPTKQVTDRESAIVRFYPTAETELGKLPFAVQYMGKMMGNWAETQ